MRTTSGGIVSCSRMPRHALEDDCVMQWPVSPLLLFAIL
jgi:hypothetical protein